MAERHYEQPDDWLLPFAVRLDEAVDWQRAEQELRVRVRDDRGQGGIWKPAWIAAD